MTYRLNIHKIDRSCLFDLTWGKGQRLTASLVFPTDLPSLYDTWRRAYLGYYKQALRGRVGATGQVGAVEVDWHSQLVQAEARLLSEFHKWLKHGDLFDLRQEVIASIQAKGEASRKVELFLTCTPLDIARLPWETWEFSPQVQIVRSPATIRAETGNRQSFRRGKTRVLAILGDETGLNFASDRTTLNAQKHLLDIHSIGWQPGEELNTLKQRICQAIADPLGWDVLFFAGHSNEAAGVNGQIAIAPHTALSIKDLTPYLKQAQQRGLQFALFNSCSGLDIAQGLINLGLSQVAIMREPIHNEVAQTFLVQFLQRLTRYENVQEALRGACQFLKLEQNLTYPSAYLVPSLFRHPESTPYQIQPTGWRVQIQRWQPTQREALIVTALTLLSLWLPLHPWLMDVRVWMQAVYRDRTGQVAAEVNPPILLVQIDQETFTRWGVQDYKPMNRALLAAIITRLQERQAKVIGIDYILDLAQPNNDSTLNQALQQAIKQNQIWPVFITDRNPSGSWISPYAEVIHSDWILQGDAWVPLWHLLPRRKSVSYKPPFSYQLAVAHRLVQKAKAGEPDVPRPSLQGQSLDAQVQAYIRGNNIAISDRADLHPLTHFSYRLRQRWLQPLIDFSIPPEQIYRPVSAWQLLTDPATPLPPDGVVIVAAGGYYTAGIARDGEDNLPLPPAVGYWRDRNNQSTSGFTGGEAHAYMTHHLLTHRFVIPIPDLWIIGVAALVGKALTLYGKAQISPMRLGAGLGGAIAGYGILSLQLYISTAVMLPWLLPSLTLWLYWVAMLKENAHE